MKRCLELARLGMGQVAPNPMVGCVIVHDGKIIGEGYHKKFGDPHAEANAIASVADLSLLPEATLFVNLEPCTHIGKTAACADLISKSGIPNIVIGVLDVNDEVSGGGAEHLQLNNAKVLTGVLEAECRELNKRFFTFHEKKRPYIILKWAESKDGFMAPIDGSQRWITTEDSKRLVHKWRTEEQAIMVGTNTVIIDNPKLTSRLWEGNNPIRITIDNKGRIPADSNLLNGEATTIIYGSHANSKMDNVEYVSLPQSPSQLEDMLVDLHARGILSLLVEGGQQLLNSFIDIGLWDEARVFKGQKEFDTGLKVSDLEINHEDEEQIGQDWLSLYLNKN